MTRTRAAQSSKSASAVKAVSLRTLAEYLKLSPATVSVVINDSPAAKAIPKHTKDRVLQAARKLQYRRRAGCNIGESILGGRKMRRSDLKIIVGPLPYMSIAE